MFRIDPEPTFAADAALTAPGQADPAILPIRWKHLRRDDLKKWIDALASSDLSDVDGLAEVIAGWDGVVDAQGKEVPFSREALRELLGAYHTAGAELVRAYVRALTESRLGN
jgi:hypothetical protein